MAGTLDSILNFSIPLIILVVVLWFIYSKLLKPSGMIEWVKDMASGVKPENRVTKQKEIVYG